MIAYAIKRWPEILKDGMSRLTPNEKKEYDSFIAPLMKHIESEKFIRDLFRGTGNLDDILSNAISFGSPAALTEATKKLFDHKIHNLLGYMALEVLDK